MTDESTTSKPAKTWKNVGVRAVTALIFAGVCFSPFYFGGAIWTLLVALLGARVVWEWVRMSDLEATSLAYAIPLVGLIITLTYGYTGEFSYAFFAVLVTAAIAVIERLRRGGGLWAGLGFIYIGVPCLSFVALRGHEVGFSAPGFLLLIFLMTVVIAADTGAYFGGSYFQGPKMAPKLSPKKTWSGFACGCLAGVILGAVTAKLMGFSFGMGALLALPIVIFSVLGDFLESALKRKLQVKDAGGLLPGHGGLLDRLDSLMMVVVVVIIAMHVWPNLWPL